MYNKIIFTQFCGYELFRIKREHDKHNQICQWRISWFGTKHESL